MCHCQNERIVSLLEGGYSEGGITEGVRRHVEALEVENFNHNGSEADMDGLADLNISVKMHGVHGMGASALSLLIMCAFYLTNQQG